MASGNLHHSHIRSRQKVSRIHKNVSMILAIHLCIFKLIICEGTNPPCQLHTLRCHLTSIMRTIEDPIQNSIQYFPILDHTGPLRTILLEAATYRDSKPSRFNLTRDRSHLPYCRSQRIWPPTSSQKNNFT